MICIHINSDIYFTLLRWMYFCFGYRCIMLNAQTVTDMCLNPNVVVRNGPDRSNYHKPMRFYLNVIQSAIEFELLSEKSYSYSFLFFWKILLSVLQQRTTVLSACTDGYPRWNQDKKGPNRSFSCPLLWGGLISQDPLPDWTWWQFSRVPVGTRVENRASTV